jgi:hypothetical protein
MVHSATPCSGNDPVIEGELHILEYARPPGMRDAVVNTGG